MLLTQEEAYGMGPALVDAHGNRTELDAESYKVVKTVLRVINGGKAKEDADRALTTGQVAELLGVSSRTVARMVDSGDLPCVGVSEGGASARSALRCTRLQTGICKKNAVGSGGAARAGHRRRPLRYGR